MDSNLFAEIVNIAWALDCLEWNDTRVTWFCWTELLGGSEFRNFLLQKGSRLCPTEGNSPNQSYSGDGMFRPSIQSILLCGGVWILRVLTASFLGILKLSGPHLFWPFLFPFHPFLVCLFHGWIRVGKVVVKLVPLFPFGASTFNSGACIQIKMNSTSNFEVALRQKRKTTLYLYLSIFRDIQ